MGLQVWTGADAKRGVVLALREDEVFRLEVAGNRVRRDVVQIMEALQHGRAPDAVGAASVQVLRLAAIEQARVSSDQGRVEFRAEGEGGMVLKFSTSGRNAGVIAQSVLSRTGRSFREDVEEIAVARAVAPPVAAGVVVGFLWAMVWLSARKAGLGWTTDAIVRRAGIPHGLLAASVAPGATGTLAIIGVGVLVCLSIWAATRVARRPRWSVWRAESVA